MMLVLRHDLVPSDCLRMNGDALRSVADLNVRSAIPYPYLFACQLPRHRIPAPLPGNVCIARYPALLVIHVRIRLTAADRLHGKLVLIPPEHYLLMSRPVHSLVGDFCDPPAQFGVQVRQIRRLTTE